MQETISRNSFDLAKINDGFMSGFFPANESKLVKHKLDSGSLFNSLILILAVLPQSELCRGKVQKCRIAQCPLKIEIISASAGFTDGNITLQLYFSLTAGRFFIIMIVRRITKNKNWPKAT